MSDDIKKQPAGKFLYETGLLYEINRKILHPLGLALEVIIYDADDGEHKSGDVELGMLWDYSEDPEGMMYGDEEIANGTVKLLKYLADGGFIRLKTRQTVLGGLYQGMDLFSIITTPVDFIASSNLTGPLPVVTAVANSRKKSLIDSESPTEMPKAGLPTAERNILLKKKAMEEHPVDYEEDENGRRIVKKRFNKEDLAILQETRKTCPHPAEKIESAALTAGGATIFCTLCGTTFQLKDKIEEE